MKALLMHLSILILVSLTIGLPAKADQCVLLFNNEINTRTVNPTQPSLSFDKPLDLLIRILERKAAFESQFPGKDPYNFTLGANFEGVPKQMLKEIDVLMSQYPEQKQRLQILKGKVEQLIKDDIPYGQFVELSETFSTVVGRMLGDRESEGDPFTQILNVPGTLRQGLRDNMFMIPTFESFHLLSKFISTRIGGIYAIELVLKDTRADGGLMPPDIHFYHDKLHTRDMMSMDLRMLQHLPILERIRLLKSLSVLMDNMLKNIEAQSEKRLIKIFIFAWIHEHPGINFLEFLNPNTRKLKLPWHRSGKSFVDRELGFKEDQGKFRRAERKFNKWRRNFIKKNLNEIQQLDEFKE